jgi:transposase InsO family protein
LKTPQGNKYILMFICHLTKFVEAYPIPNQAAEIYVRVYASQIVTRHGACSKLITDQGRAFMSKFFQETCRILGVRTVYTNSFHPQSNAQVERWHRSLHAGLSHYINSAHTNWDTLVPFFPMPYRAIPNIVNGYSPFFLLHGREMTLPSRETLKPQLPKENFSPDQRLESLKSSLRMAYKLAAKANRKSHNNNNKRLYDHKAKVRKFQVKDLEVLCYPARNPGLTKKFYSPWSDLFVITRKISEFNYVIADQNNRRQIVHVNRLKRCYNSELWKTKSNSKVVRKPRNNSKRRRIENTENEFPIGLFPLVKTDDLENTNEHENPLDQILDAPDPNQHADTPTFDRNDLVYLPQAHPGRDESSRRSEQTFP